jgi:hypothetical protein
MTPSMGARISDLTPSRFFVFIILNKPLVHYAVMGLVEHKTPLVVLDHEKMQLTFSQDTPIKWTRIKAPGALSKIISPVFKKSSPN